MGLSFKDFLMLSEDAAQELAQLVMTRQQLVIKKTMADKQVDTQIAAIDKLIYQKEKQKQAEDQKNGAQMNKNDPNQQQQQQGQQGNQPQGNRTVQPGSSGMQTPGSAAPQQQG